MKSLAVCLALALSLSAAPVRSHTRSLCEGCIAVAHQDVINDGSNPLCGILVTYSGSIMDGQCGIPPGAEECASTPCLLSWNLSVLSLACSGTITYTLQGGSNAQHSVNLPAGTPVSQNGSLYVKCDGFQNIQMEFLGYRRSQFFECRYLCQE
jgi:hypothetical protein